VFRQDEDDCVREYFLNVQVSHKIISLFYHSKPYSLKMYDLMVKSC